MVGDEPDRAGDDVGDTPLRQLAEMVEDVGAEPWLARLRLALEGNDQSPIARDRRRDGGLEELLR